ncbi:MAG: hypothetical protein K2Q17_12645 [Nitrospiraceae bacterium]|jgi:hypothetical protein|nr:hypothetical protein [Nitrospiraceae bacterium]
MKSLLQSFFVLMTATLVSGCICLMPMNDMSMKEKKDSGMTKVDERGSGMSMTGTTA